MAPVFELLPLRRVDVLGAARDYAINENAFIEQVLSRDAQPLATRPISLRFLLSTFSRDGQLPNSKLRLYEEGCRLLCSDEGSWDRARPTTDAFRRMAIAARIAAVGTFTNRAAVSREGAAPADALRVVDILGGTESVHGATYRVDQNSVDDTLEGTALFSLRATNTFGWTHQSYREFLAAWFLSHRDLPLDELVRLYAPEGARVPLPLREVAAWHATMLPDLFAALLDRDPDVLMRSDTAIVSAPARMQLVAAFLRRIDEYEALDRYNYADYRKLDHQGLPEQLRPYIGAREKNFIVRRAAIDIAGACKVKDLSEDLAAIVRDHTDNQRVRQAAASALGEFETESAVSALQEIVDGTTGSDPDDEMFGSALQALWPKHMTTEKLFAVLRFPRRTGFSGEYFLFFRKLTDEIQDADLVIALPWVLKMSAVSDYTVVARARRDLIVRALRAAPTNPAIAELLGQIAKAALRRGKSFLDSNVRRNELDAVRNELTIERRRAVLSSLLPHLHDERLAWSAMHYRPSLIEPEDLAWFASRATPTGDGPDESVCATLSAKIYHRAGYPHDQEQIDAVLAAFETSPTFRGALARFLAPVDLGSTQAIELRAAWESAERMRMESESSDTPDAEAAEERRVISAQLDALEGGCPEIWLDLYWSFTGHGFGRIVESPHWQAISGDDRQRVFHAAREFLEKTEDADQTWLDTSSIPGTALAAYAAISMIFEHDAALLTPEIWRRWAHVLIAGHGDDQPLQPLTSAAFEHAPNEMTGTIVRTLNRESRAHGFTIALRHVVRPLPEVLQAPLLAAADGMSERPYGELLDALIESGNGDALIKARAGLDATEPKRAAVCGLLLVKHGEQVWNDVLDRMHRDSAFASAFAEELAGEHERSARGTTAMANITPLQRANLYVTLLRAATSAGQHRDDDELLHRDDVTRFRDGLLQLLVDGGEVEAVQWITEQEPQREWLRWQLVTAKMNRANASWAPLPLAEFLQRAHVIATVVLTRPDDAPLVVFQSSVANPAQLGITLQNMVSGLVVEAAPDRIALRGSEETIRAVVELAEKGLLVSRDNPFLGIRHGAEWLFETVPLFQPPKSIPRDITPDDLRKRLATIDVLS